MLDYWIDILLSCVVICCVVYLLLSKYLLYLFITDDTDSFEEASGPEEGE